MDFFELLWICVERNKLVGVIHLDGGGVGGGAVSHPLQQDNQMRDAGQKKEKTGQRDVFESFPSFPLLNLINLNLFQIADPPRLQGQSVCCTERLFFGLNGKRKGV